MTSKALQTFSSGSERSSKGKDCFNLKFSWDLIESLDIPIISVLCFLKILYLSLNSCPSVVQPGVLSFG